VFDPLTPSSLVLSAPDMSPDAPAATTFAMGSLPVDTCVEACAVGVRESLSRESLPMVTVLEVLPVGR
jgi:hypothetical protein